VQIRETHLALLLVIAVIIGSYFFQRQEADRRADAQRRADVSACQRQTERVVINSVGWNEVVKGRRERQDTRRAIDRALAVEQALMETVVPPKGIPVGDLRLFETATVVYPDGKIKLVLTDRTRRLLKAGCERAFPDS
jgi:hypothetical protein